MRSYRAKWGPGSVECMSGGSRKQIWSASPGKDSQLTSPLTVSQPVDNFSSLEQPEKICSVLVTKQKLTEH